MRNLKVAKSKMDITKIKYNFFVFDVETTKLEPMSKNFVFGVIYGFQGCALQSKIIKSTEEFKKEFQSIHYKNKYIFAHNAEFDLLTIFGNIITEVDNSAIFNGKFISAKYKDVTFGDSMNIYPSSVEKIGELMEMPKGNNEKIKTGQLTKENLTNEDIEYCTQDCRIIFKALQKIFENIGDIKLTLASLAMYQFRLNYLNNNIQFSELVDGFYESYYGGRTEAFVIGKVNAKVYDINSLYPYAMIHTVFPDIKRLRKVVDLDVKYLLYLIKMYEGMAKVTVRHKPTFLGYVPCRMEINKVQKLVFPVGEFESVLNFNELRFALEENIIEILKVDYAIYGNPTESPFITFVNDNYKKRMQAKTKLDSTIYKNILNSLYGRFGMRMKMTTTYYNDFPFRLIQELQDFEKYYELQMFNKERNDCYVITENEQMKNSFFSIPTFSSYITSSARIILLKALLKNEKNGLCYCDTDSIFLTGYFEGNISDNIGDFKQEPKNITEINGLKNYRYINENGEERIIIKGISKGSIQNGKDEKVFEIQKYYKTKQAIRQGKEAGEAFIMRKELKHDYDKRVILENGLTKAILL